MKIKTDRMINEAYLIIEDNPSKMTEDDFETGMLSGNAIDGLLPLLIKQSEGGFIYNYSIRGKVPLTSKYEGRELRSEALLLIIKGLKEILSRCEEYMILTDHVLLSPEYIYTDSVTGELSLCVYPYYESSLKEELGKLAEYLIAHTDHNENLAIDLSYGFYRQVMSGDYDLEKLLSITEIKTPPKPEEKCVEVTSAPPSKTGDNGKSILILLIFLVVTFCFALCVLMLYFR